jgi:hypothetical protein
MGVFTFFPFSEEWGRLRILIFCGLFAKSSEAWLLFIVSCFGCLFETGIAGHICIDYS